MFTLNCNPFLILLSFIKCIFGFGKEYPALQRSSPLPVKSANNIRAGDNSIYINSASRSWTDRSVENKKSLNLVRFTH
jgi:hypothetical protein